MLPTVLAGRRRVLHTYVTDDGRHGITAADAPTTIIRTTSHRTTAPRRRGAAVVAVVGAVLFVADLAVLAAIANGEVLW